MRALMITALLIGCGDGRNGITDDDVSCIDIAERWCCGVAEGELRDNCVADTMVGVCRGCTKSIDAEACSAALDGAEQCGDVCGDVIEQGCMAPPAECLCE